MTGITLSGRVETAPDWNVVSAIAQTHTVSMGLMPEPCRMAWKCRVNFTSRIVAKLQLGNQPKFDNRPPTWFDAPQFDKTYYT